MSGVEIVGIIIGIIPLIIEAYDHSDCMIKRVSALRVHGFARESTTLKFKFYTQKAIFRAVATHLLSSLKNECNGVIERLKSHVRRGVDDEDIQNDDYEENNKLDTLDDLLRSCKQVLLKMSWHLASITSTLKEFEQHTPNAQRVLTHLRARIRLARGLNRVEPDIDAFGDLNKVFGTIGNEIIRLLVNDDRDRQTYKHSGQTTGPRSLQASRLYAYKSVQHASSRLYKTISEKWCCNIHEKHVVHLSSVQRLEQCGTTDPVGFKIVITGIKDDSLNGLHNLTLEVQHDQCQISQETPNSNPAIISETNKSQSTFKPELLPQAHTLECLTSSLQEISQGKIPEIKKHGEAKLKSRPKYNTIYMSGFGATVNVRGRR